MNTINCILKNVNASDALKLKIIFRVIYYYCYYYYDKKIS